MDWRVRSVAQLLVLGFLLAVVECGTAEHRVVCYYTNWSVYRPGTAKFSPQNINPYLCTHLIYAFGGFTKDNALKPFDKYQDIEKGGYAKFTGLKTYNKNLKTMLAVGGWNEGSSRFSPMVADPERRKQFVKNSVKFLRQNHFDGLDLDWEYPAFRDGGKPRDRDNYASLVQELREAYERESSKTGRPRLLLTMAVPAGIEYINKGYDIPKLNKYLDFINLLSYDYHSSYEPAVNHHSPLYPLEEDNEYNFDTELTVDYTIKHLLESGASADKIVLGIPTYGRSYTLFNEDATDIGSPSDGPGEEGDATREKGYLAYYEICEGLIESDEWDVVSPNPNAMGPYAYRGNQWVGYDDEAIVRLKAQYVNEHGLGGIMFWSIDNDDFRGKCHDRPYPLIEAAKEAMLAGSEKSSDEEKSTRPTKPRTDSNFIGRKIGGGRRRTTEAPVVSRQENSRKRVNALKSRSRSRTVDNSDEEEVQVQVNGRNRGQFVDSEEDEEASNNSKVGSNVLASVEESEDQEKEASKTRNRARNEQGRNRKHGSNSRRRSTTEASISEPIESQAENHRRTTPEPPTTPDPGTDFKCKDEGFFSHPRDCKKYFWCLEAPGLGIVAHHFTCPAGLVFNKGADSCDYPRNVVCPKAEPAAEPTTRAPVKAATSRTTRIHSTTRRSSTRTTTEAPEDSSEYEYYDDEEEEEENVPVTTTTARTLQYKTINRNRPTTSATTETPSTTTRSRKTSTSRSYQAIPSRGSSMTSLTSLEDSEEDPKVIQELIELIKKAGGIEELEKQLHLQGKGSETSGQSGSATNKADVTPATISRSLFERVLNRQAANSGTTLFRRTTVAPTTVAVTTDDPERLDSQASDAQRSKPSFRNGPGQAQFEGLDNIPEVKALRRERPQYTTINRQRPSTESPDEDSEEIADDNTNGASAEETLLTNPPEATPSTHRETHGYVDIRRSRTSTARSNVLEDGNESDARQQRRRPVTSEIESEDEEDDEPKNVQTTTETVHRRIQSPIQEEASGTTSRYSTIQRVRSTTQATEEASPEESDSPTTIANDKVEDKVSPPEATTTNEATIEQSVRYTTQTPNLASTDLPVQNIDPSTTLLPTTVRVVEEISTTDASVVVSSTSTQESTNDEAVPKGSTTVSQPRPFGFQRRTRPTTTTSTLTSSPETTTSVNSDSGRVKVPSETVRLPTLKELIGHKTIVAHDYTSTTPITLSIKNLLNDNAVNPSEYTKYTSETVAPNFETELPQDVVESTKTTEVKEGVQIAEEEQLKKYVKLETAENNDYAHGVGDNRISRLNKFSPATESSLPPTLPIRVLKQDRTPSRRRRVKLVNIPVRILESDRPLTDVILEVPEYKVNSILRSLLRVEILNQDITIDSNGEKSKDINTHNQRTRYNPNENPSKDDLSNEHGSDELLSTDASTNPIVSANKFTSTTPSISTVRGILLVTPSKSPNRGFYVTKNIESNTVYENITPPTTSQVVELHNELTQRVSTTTDQLSTSNEETSTEGINFITTDSYYTGLEESTSQQLSTTTEQPSTPSENLSTTEQDSVTSTISAYYAEGTWPSMISTSLENFNDILANNNDVDAAALVTQKTTVTADTTPTEDLISTTENENNVKSTTETAFAESDERFYTLDSQETVESSSTEESSSTMNTDILSTTWRSEINTITGDPENYSSRTKSTTPDPQQTTINQINTDSTEESSTPCPEATSTTTSESQTNAIGEELDYYNSVTNTATPDVQQTGPEAISTTTSESETNAIGKELDYYNSVTNTATPDVQQTTINQNTYSTTESSTPDSEPISTITPELKINIISEDLDYNYITLTSDAPQRTTSNQNIYSTTESSTLGSEISFSTETSSKSDFQSTTVSDPEGTSDSTNLSSTEASAPDFENTVTYVKNAGFNTEVNLYTETISTIQSTSDFRTTTVTAEPDSDFKSTKFTPDEPLDNDSVSQTTTTDPTGSITSVSTPDVQTTTFSNLEPETSTLDFITTSTVPTGTTLSDSITTGVPSTTIAIETEIDTSTTNDIASTITEVKTTTASNSESTTESGSTATVTIQTPADQESAIHQTEVSLANSTEIIQQVDVQTVSTLVTSGSESTVSPSTNAYELTTGLNTTKKESGPANEVQEILRQPPKHFEPTQLATGSEFPGRGLYRSPTAIPEKKAPRRRIIKKRIYGVRRPHIKDVAANEPATHITTLNTDGRLDETEKPKRRFIRRRIINHSTGKIIVDDTFRKSSTIIKNRNTTSDSNPEFVQNVDNSPELNNNLVNKLLRHRTTYRRRPAKNQTNSSIEGNVSSQNNSASNDVQSSSVSSTNSNQRRRILVQRFRYKGSGPINSTTVSPSPSPSSSSQGLLVAEVVSQLNSTESTVEDELGEDKRKTSGQDDTDVTIDNLSSGSESYGKVSVYGREELPRTESISEALQMSEDEQTNGEVILFKNRGSNSRKPGTLLRQSRPSASSATPESELPTTISPSTRVSNNVAIRRRFRLGQRPTTPSTNAGAQSEAPPSEHGETLKSGTDENVLESLDQSGNAQEVEVTVAAESPSSPAPRVSPGRTPFRTSVRRRIITTEAPQVTVSSTHPTVIRQRQRPKAFEKITENQPARPRHPAIIDYDYYEDSEERIVGKARFSDKISFTSGGSIRCLDQGNFPHPTSCKKFITCARMVNGQVIGTEYTCPKRLSYDPVGGICNWSAGLGCKE